MTLKFTPLKRKIIEALQSAPGNELPYHTLAHLLWPPETHPKAWNYSSNGGPPGWAMPLGRALRELRAAGIAYEMPASGGGGHGDVRLLVHNGQSNGRR